MTEVSVPLVGERGAVIAFMRILPSVSEVNLESIVMIDSVSAKEWGEERVQLLEGRSYEYEVLFKLPGYFVRENHIVRRSRFSGGGVERGVIKTGNYTGSLSFIVDCDLSADIAVGSVEVRSIKVDYRTDYRKMLSDIAAWSTDLLLNLHAPTTVRMKHEFLGSTKSIAQKFSFLKYSILNDDFRLAIERVIASPNEKRVTSLTKCPIGRIRGLNPAIVRQMAQGQPRTPVLSSHALSGSFSSLPKNLFLDVASWNNDTSENRFVKYIVTFFADFLKSMEVALQRSRVHSDRLLLEDVKRLHGELGLFLSRPFFRRLSSLGSFPAGSIVMQKRPGYREILSCWVRFHAAASLAWDGGEEIYDAGKRDVATLYEYWVFIKLVELIGEKFELSRKSLGDLLVKTVDGFGLRLKSGRHTPIEGVSRKFGKELNIKLSFNRTFTRKESFLSSDGQSNHPSAGSWTKSMRPDYTLTVWPTDISEYDAELLERIVHIHFDAKYRVDGIAQLFGSEIEDDSLRSETDQVVTSFQDRSSGNARRDDLLKMHAYRDAIRRTEGAYVLYPGSTNVIWRQYHELIPGLGAFVISPRDDDEVSMLSEFIDDVLLQLIRKVY
jgi:predicted component of viral defense system (DUF524 family)